MATQNPINNTLAGTALSGSTLAAGITASSLTSVGTKLGIGLTAVNALDVSGNGTVSGWARFGSNSNPANMSAGDLTANKLSVGNSSFGTDSICDFAGTMTSTSVNSNLINGISTLTPAGTSTSDFRTFNMSARPTANQDFNTVRAGFFEVRPIGANMGNLTQANGVFADGLTFGSATVAAGTISRCRAFESRVLNSSGSATGTLSAGVNFYASPPVVGSLTFTGQAAFMSEALTQATNNSYMVLGRNTIPVGNWGIFLASSNDSVFAGNVAIGSTTAPTHGLDVTGGLNATGAVRIGSLSNLSGMTTAGDITGVRLSLGGTAVSAANGEVACIRGTMVDTTGTPVLMGLQATVSPSGSTTTLAPRTFSISVLYSTAQNVGTSNVLNAGCGVYAENRIADCGTVVELHGVKGVGMMCNASTNTLGNTTTVVGGYFQGLSSASVPTATPTIASCFGVKIGTASVSSGFTLTGQAGLTVGILSGATNNTSILIGATSFAIPTGNYGIYQSDTNTNHLGGSLELVSTVTTYNNIATVSNGVPAEYAKIDTTGLTANVAAATLYAVPASGAGMYRVSSLVVLTTAATVSSTLPNVQIVYTDNDTGGSVTIDATPILGVAGIGQTGALTANTVGTTSTGVIVINAKASTNIQYQTVNYASTIAGMAYALHIKLEAM